MLGQAEADRLPPGEDGFDKLAKTAGAARAPGDTGPEIDYLTIVKDAERKGRNYIDEHLRGDWDRSYKAFRNQHFSGSKYHHPEFRNRSKLFRPKTRTAVRKSNAAAAAALFATRDALKCTAGNESDPRQKASAALLQEVLSYRTDRTSGLASIPWFRTCAGAHQDAMLQAACVSKQYWKLEFRSKGEEPQTFIDEETGEEREELVEILEPYIDRPDVMLFPLENVILSTDANWLDPIQSASVAIFKFPMTLDEVEQKQKSPHNPWNDVPLERLRASASAADKSASATRQSREGGVDRLDSRYTGENKFDIVWVFEVFIKAGGKDITFYSAEDREYLTDPAPVEKVYPEQGGERPYTFGVVNLESHRLYPMAPAASLQQTQMEINDFANLTLDQAKLSVSPVTKVRRGKQVDLDALLRRGPNAQILVTDPEDVTWDNPPSVDSSMFAIMERLNNDFDTAAGIFDQSSVQSSRQVGELATGLKLLSGAANAVQEFDLRVWIETWVEPTLGQLVKLIQYYESDATILGICGDRAQLFEKFGVSEVTDDLLDQQISVRVDAGLGNADPQQKLQKLAGGLKILEPTLEHPKFTSGELELDIEAIWDEVLGLSGYRDGAARFIKKGQPKQEPPGAMAQLKKLLAETADKEAAAKLKTAQAGKVQVEAAATVAGVKSSRDEAMHRMQMERAGFARDLVSDHHGRKDVEADREIRTREFDASQQQPKALPEPRQEPDQDEAPTDMLQQLVAALGQRRNRSFKIERGPDGRIAGLTETSQEQ